MAWHRYLRETMKPDHERVTAFQRKRRGETEVCVAL